MLISNPPRLISQITVDQNIPMAGFHLTGLGAPAAQNDSLRYGQLEIRNAEVAVAAAILNTKISPVPNGFFWLANGVNLVTDVARVADLAWTDVDITAQTSANAKYALLMLRISVNLGATGTIGSLFVRKNGDVPVLSPYVNKRCHVGEADAENGFVIVALDAGQVFEYTIIVGVGNTVSSVIDLLGYIE